MQKQRRTPGVFRRPTCTNLSAGARPSWACCLFKALPSPRAFARLPTLPRPSKPKLLGPPPRSWSGCPARAAPLLGSLCPFDTFPPRVLFAPDRPEGLSGEERLSRAALLSAFRVFHPLGGLLLAALCRFVSPGWRPWGSHDPKPLAACTGRGVVHPHSASGSSRKRAGRREAPRSSGRRL